MNFARVALVVASLATALSVAGAENDSDAGASPREPQAAPAGAETDRASPPAPAGGFTPSERIGADSAVSFPVDI
jgi:hypothetical protein